MGWRCVAEIELGASLDEVTAWEASFGVVTALSLRCVEEIESGLRWEEETEFGVRCAEVME